MIMKRSTELLLDTMEKLKQINIKLSAIVPSESTKIQIEILYFDILDVLRSNGPNSEFESTVEKIKELHETMQIGVNGKRRTSRNTVSAIKTFKNSLRIHLRKLIRNGVEKNII